MINIPTDLLRTLVAVVDLRSFTKAAASLGVTQPAVSAQIKRLQYLLGKDVFDRSAQGISLTPHGEMIVSYARRLLSINDQIMEIGGPSRRADQVIRIGAPGDFVSSILSHTLARFRGQWPGVRFNVRTGSIESLLRDLRQGDVDLVVSLSPTIPVDARHYWEEEVVWVRGESTRVDLSQPIPLVSYGDKSLNRQLSTNALKKAGLDWEEVFVGPSLLSLSGAVASGLGVMALARRRAIQFGLLGWNGASLVWDDTPLPELDSIYCGIYVREGPGGDVLDRLADLIAEVLHPAAATAEAETSAPLSQMRTKHSAA
ncbi:MAG TPA: LysR substrate-binding domain-containing protein [Pseudolabrys sp.]|jgi:DNA-binding transcriptional LysR family regulator|nr:LysR substrate-binding domain-containing protein [Pseudolabrys sp.]